MLRYEHANTDDPTSYLNNAYVLDGVPLVPGAAFNAVGVPIGLRNESTRAGVNQSDTSFEQEVDTYQLTASFDLGFGNLTSYTQYSTLDAQSTNFEYRLYRPEPGAVRIRSAGTTQPSEQRR